jgi:serpin B
MSHGGAAVDGPARADDAFGADLYRVLAGADADPGNTVFSPASIAAALRMALLGARGETAAELARALHLSGPEAAPAGLRLLGDVIRGSLDRPAAAGREDFIFRTPNTMWVQSGLPLDPGFLAEVTDASASCTAAAVHDADFVHEPEKVRKEINRVIAEQTEGKIRDLLAPGLIDAATRLVLANAIYLKAAWAHPFPEGATHDAPFHLDGAVGGATVTAPTMQVTAQFGYARGDGYQAVVLPYAGGRLAMAIVLPDGPLAPLAGRLSPGGTAAGVRALLAGVTQARVQLSLPRFRFRRKFQLAGPLGQLGVVRAFSDGADFSGITRAAPLHISAVEHQAYLDVDEKGTEAAAATAVVMRVSAVIRQDPPVTVTVDRPFLFAITDTATGLPLFLGQVTNPAGG